MNQKPVHTKISETVKEVNLGELNFKGTNVHRP